MLTDRFTIVTMSCYYTLRYIHLSNLPLHVEMTPAKTKPEVNRSA